jgi:hypothetical protein
MSDSAKAHQLTATWCELPCRMKKKYSIGSRLENVNTPFSPASQKNYPKTLGKLTLAYFPHFVVS